MLRFKNEQTGKYLPEINTKKRPKTRQYKQPLSGLGPGYPNKGDSQPKKVFFTEYGKRG
jgi:hypothetical protein